MESALQPPRLVGKVHNGVKVDCSQAFFYESGQILHFDHGIVNRNFSEATGQKNLSCVTTFTT